MLRRSFFKLMSSLPFLGGLGGTLKQLSASARLERLKAIALHIMEAPAHYRFHGAGQGIAWPVAQQYERLTWWHRVVGNPGFPMHHWGI